MLSGVTESESGPKPGPETFTQEQLDAFAAAFRPMFDQLSAAFRELGRILVEAFRPLVELAAALFGSPPPDHLGDEILVWAHVNRLWSHTVFVCPEWECGARMEREGDALVCLGRDRHRWDVPALKARSGFPGWAPQVLLGQGQ